MKKLLIMILILLFSLACGGANQKQIALNGKISVCDQGYLKYLNYEGKETYRIKLPTNVKDFRIKGDYICFVGLDENLGLFNLKSKKTINIPPGPYFYKKEMNISSEIIKNEGERIRDIDFLKDEKIIVFTARPDVSHKIFSNGYISTIECKEFQECSNTIIYDIKKRKAICVSQNEIDGYYGYCSRPLLYKNIAYYNWGGTLIYYDIKRNEEKRDFYKIFIKYYKSKEDWQFINIFSLKDDLLYFIHNKYEKDEPEKTINNALEEVYVYNLKKHDFRKICDLRDMRFMGYPRDRILDISRDQKYILMNELSYQLYLVRIKDRTKNQIYEFKDNSCFTAQFIDE